MKGKEQKDKTLIYPNPSNTVNFKIIFNNGNAKDVAVHDLSGKMIMKFNNQLNNLDITGLKTGFYTINIIDRTNGDKLIQKIVLK